MKKGSFALRFFLYASLFSLVWLGGYLVLSEVFAVAEQQPVAENPKATPAVLLPSTSSARWSVLAVVDETGEVTTFRVCYANFWEDVFVVLTIPTNTRVELSTGAYEVLRVHHPELPELFMISELYTLFSEEVLCMAAEEAVVSLLGVRPTVCYVMEEAVYEALTEKEEDQILFRTPDSVRDTILWTMERVFTDGTMEDELVYVESYRDIRRVIYEMLPGTAEAQQYRPDYDKIQVMVNGYLAGQWDEQAQ